MVVGVNHVDEVRYGRGDNASAYLFKAGGCVLSIPHTQIRCSTGTHTAHHTSAMHKVSPSVFFLAGEGAGTRLTWAVTIGGQTSRSATTSYAPPSITSFSGQAGGVEGGSTDGGEQVQPPALFTKPVTKLSLCLCPASVQVVLHGSNFGPGGGESPSLPSFLEEVTYGPSTGEEYSAQGCTLLNHGTIKCSTVPHTGAQLKWRVTVRGQRSALSSGHTSARDPFLLSALPGVVSTQGGQRVVLTGRYLGLADASAKVIVHRTLPNTQQSNTVGTKSSLLNACRHTLASSPRSCLCV